MPYGALGEQITFAVQQDPDEKFSQYITVNVRPGDTVAKIAARRGHPDLAGTIAKLNGIRSIHTQLLTPRGPVSGGVGLPFPRPTGGRHTIRLPGIMRQSDVLSVLCGDNPPLIKDGYATYDRVPRPGREGLSRFTGFNPVAMDVSIQWAAWTNWGDGSQVEGEITRLEKMAGRGDFGGAATGPPAVIRLSVTDNNGNVVPLIPRNYQWMPSAHGMLYRISNITWDPTPKRLGFGTGGHGRRVEQKAVVEVTKYTPFSIVEPSAAKRSRQRNKSAHS